MNLVKQKSPKPTNDGALTVIWTEPLALFYKEAAVRAQVAQLVEQRTENPCVGGSIPPLGTTDPWPSGGSALCGASSWSHKTAQRTSPPRRFRRRPRVPAGVAWLAAIKAGAASLNLGPAYQFGPTVEHR
jgi:hypothetical protein